MDNNKAVVKDCLTTEDYDKSCGNCSLFTDEDINGEGWCKFHQESAKCSSSCEYGLFKGKER